MTPPRSAPRRGADQPCPETRDGRLPRVHAIYGPPDHEPGTVHQTHEDARTEPNED